MRYTEDQYQAFLNHLIIEIIEEHNRIGIAADQWKSSFRLITPDFHRESDETGTLIFPTARPSAKKELPAEPERGDRHGNALTTPEEERQMLIQLKGVSVNSTPRSDGRYQGYAILNGEKRYFYGRTKKEVEDKIIFCLKEDERQRKKVNKKEKYSPSFGEYAENWIKLYKEPNLKPTSLNTMRITLEPAMKTFGDRRISSITSDELQTLLLEIGAPRMRELCMGTLRQIFKKAMMQQIIKQNPCDLIEIKKHKTAKRKALTEEEEQRFLEEGRKTEYDLLYRTMLATGMRIGEALALTPTDVDTKENMIHVTKNVVFIDGKRIEQDTPKSEAGNRDLPIPHALAMELTASDKGTIFPFSYNSVSLAIRRIAHRTGIKVSSHILRHTFATRLEEAGIPPKIKQYLLGHSTLEMTENVYTDVQQSYVKRLSDAIREIFSPKNP